MCQAQVSSKRKSIDSLLTELKNPIPDSNRIKLFNELGTYYININKDSAIDFTLKALQLAQKNGSKKVIGRAYHFLGYILNKNGEYSLSMTNFDTAIQYYKESGYEKGIAEVLSIYGLSAWRVGQYDKSLRAYHKILLLDDREDFQRSKLGALINTALIYEEQERKTEAIEWYKKSLIQANKIDDNYGRMIIYTNIGSLYRYDKNFKECYEYTHKAINIAKKLNNLNELIRAQANLGASFTQDAQYDSAEYYLLTAYKTGKKIKDHTRLIKNTWHLAELYIKKDQLAKARKFGKESLKLSLDSEIPEDMAYGYEILYDIERKAGNHQLANLHADSLIFWKDSLYKATNQTELANAESAYNNEILQKNVALKSSEIKQLADRQKLFVAGFLLLLITLFAVWMYFKRKRAQEELEGELIHTQRLTESMEVYRKRRATELHDDVGQDLLLAQQSIQLQNSPDKAKDFIERALNKVRKISKDEFPYELSYVGLKTSLEYLIDLIEQNSEIIISEELCDLPEEIPVEQSLNIYRIIQEMINNSIKNKETSSVFIGMQIKENLLEITYKDNGSGFDFESSLSNSMSIGLKSIVNRVRMLKAELKNVPSISDNRYVIHVPFYT